MGPTPLVILALFLCSLLPANRAEGQPQEPQHKSPMGAMIRSAIIPGWGQVYSGHYIKAGLIFAVESGLVISAINENRKADDVYETDYEAYLDRIDRRNTLIWCTAGVIVYSMVDAYVDAHLFGFDEDQVSLGLESGATMGEVRLVLRLPVPEIR